MSQAQSNCLCCGRPPSDQRPPVRCDACTVYYCSQDCKEADASEHLKTCKGAKRAKKPQKSKEELLRPIVKKDGLPDVTLEELADCTANGRLWMGCMGRIFDVTGSEFYSAGGSYASFVGKDTSVALGKMKFNPEYFDPRALHWTRDLDERELNILQDWVDKFGAKYEVVGYIKDDGATL
mmetsp:Transcript_30818/g.67658  ORF Transcript_30818/g.67658 Transcript_30818/m.67658 type:complete len:180 (+) Transcript_30818:161-700(+)